jgi:hypothetical protein
MEAERRVEKAGGKEDPSRHPCFSLFFWKEKAEATPDSFQQATAATASCSAEDFADIIVIQQDVQDTFKNLIL